MYMHFPLLSQEFITNYDSNYANYISLSLNLVAGWRRAVTGRDVSPKWVSPSFALDKFPRVPPELSSSSSSAGRHTEPLMSRLSVMNSLKPNPFNEICLFRLPSRHKSGQGNISCSQYPAQAIREPYCPLCTSYSQFPLKWFATWESKPHFSHLPHTWSQFLRCILPGTVWGLCSGSTLSSSWAASSAGTHKD